MSGTILLLLATALWKASGWLQRRRLAFALGRGAGRATGAGRLGRLTARRANAANFGLELLAAFRGELAAGQAQVRALANSVAELDEAAARLPRTIAALGIGAGVGAALAADARAGPAELRPLLAGLAALWRVGETSGGGLAAGVAELLESERRRLDALRELRAELAGPRATALVLALLPVVGLLLGSALGADPVHWLLTSPVGWADSGLALSLVAVGVRWTRSIVARAEQP